MKTSKLTSVLYFLLLLMLFTSCGSKKKSSDKSVPVIGFLDFVEDATLAQARKGFIDALDSKGFSERKNTLKVMYRNAQGDQPALLQAADYLISQKPDLIASNTTLATITCVKRTSTVPVCMMVAPRPDIAGLTDNEGNAPANLFGVYETLDYIDTAVTLVHALFPEAKRVGTIFSQSESQSVDALNKLKKGCASIGVELISIPVTNSSETQLVTQTLLGKNIDVFFALPDNVIFSSFETVAKSCGDKKIPIITSEAGLVNRGALASFGADMYQWGFQSGLQAAGFLMNKKDRLIKPEIVAIRKKVYNKAGAQLFNLKLDSSFIGI